MSKYEETIAAIATPLSPAGISIVRISGKEAFLVADKIFRGKQKISEAQTHTIHYGHIIASGNIIDEVLLMVMKEPGSYTGENSVEINCHGGIFITQRILECVIGAGARLADPGEFTKRAFLSGRIDLSQAEAVSDLIYSENDYALKTAVKQLKGCLKNAVKNIREEILYHTAYIESALDDPEHISMEGYAEKLRQDLLSMTQNISLIVDKYDQVRLFRDGLRTVILGRPNAGKSSFMNAVLGEERAIVTHIAGTTRDVIEEKVTINGITLRLIDTAGIHETGDIIEKIGIEKAKEELEKADLIMYIIDSAAEPDPEEFEIFRKFDKKECLIIMNKSDLEKKMTEEDIEKNYRRFTQKKYPVVTVSSLTNEGFDILKEEIEKMFIRGEIAYNDEVYVTNERQKCALTDAREAFYHVIDSIDNHLPEDFYTIDLMEGYNRLGDITGEEASEDLIDEIFGKFCVGK